MRRLTALLFMFMSALGLSLLFTQQVFAVPETVTVKQAYLLDGKNQTELTELQVAPGATIEPAKYPAGKGFEFAYYIVNGLISDKAEGEAFTVGSYLNLVAVYTPKDKFAVVFVDVNGEIIRHNNKLAQYVSKGAAAEAPTDLPTKTNYKVSDDPWSDSFDNVEENKVITLQYELDTEATFTISLNGVVQTANYNDIVTLTADSDMLWKEDNRVVWYGSTYRFSALSNRTLKAEPGSAPTETIVTMNEIADLRRGHRSFLAQVYVPSGDLLEVGFLRGTKHEVTFSNKEGNIASSLVPETNEFIVSIPDTVTDNIRAYALTKSGETVKESYNYVAPLIQLDWPPTGTLDLRDREGANPWFDMGVVIHKYEGYSGQMRIIYVAEGYETISEIVPFTSGGVLKITKELWNNLVKGVEYSIKLQAIGNGTTHTDSEIANTLATVLVPLPKLNAPILSLNDNDITWSSVDHAENYELYIDDKFVATIDGLSFTINPEDLKLSYGTHIIKVVALADGYLDSEASIVFSHIDETADPLNAPEITLDGDIVSWLDVENASGYRVSVNGTDIDLANDILSFNLSTLQLSNGEYTVQVKALGDAVNYLNSEPSSIGYTVDNPLPKLNKLAQGDFVSTYLLNGVDAGHRKLEIHSGHAVYGQTGWNKIIRLGIRVNGEMIYQDYSFDGVNMQMIHTPNSTDSFFGANLPAQGTVELHIILVGNGTTHWDSEPLILSMNWKIGA